MSTYIYEELLLFGMSVGTGAFFLFFYDCIRGFRAAVSHSSFAEGLEDLLFWILCACSFFIFLDKGNSGLVRGFIVSGMLLGAWISKKVLHKYSLKMWSIFWKLPIEFAKKLRKRLLFIGKQCKLFKYKFVKSGKMRKNRFLSVKRGSKFEKQCEGKEQKAHEK